MEVEVRLFAEFRVGRFKERTIDVPDGTTLRDLIGHLDIQEEKVSIPLVNGQYSKLDRHLAANDVVSLFAAVAGG